MICIYHNADLDGICSAAIVVHKYPDCELFGMNYGDELPDIQPGEDVIMVDFCLQPAEKMVELARKVNLTWIDHHKTALEAMDKFNLDLAGLRCLGIGACVLTWMHIFADEPLPRSVRLLSDHDVWDHSDPNTLAFQYGMRLINLHPRSYLWHKLFVQWNAACLDIVDKGHTILKYEKQQNAKRINALRHDVKLPDLTSEPPGFMRLNCLAANFALTNSQLFDSVWEAEKDNYACMLVYNWRKDRWNVSLYTTHEDVDCGAIAKGYGGGGHPGAAGFQCDRLPFDLPSREEAT